MLNYCDPKLEIVSTRIFRVPRERVYSAFSDPAELVKWWGPQGFRNGPFEVFELRPGGAWRFVMYGPDGAEYPMNKHFTEVAPSERVVLKHEQPMHSFTMTMTFEEAGAGTLLTWHFAFEAEEAAAVARPFILQANEGNFDRLQAHLDRAR